MKYCNNTPKKLQTATPKVGSSNNNNNRNPKALINSDDYGPSLRKLYTVKEAAEFLSFSRRHIERMVEEGCFAAKGVVNGSLPGRKKRQIRIKGVAIQQWMDDNEA